jgi:hypothetical protein
MTRTATITVALLLALTTQPVPAAAAQSAPVVTQRERLVDGLRHETFRVRLADGRVARGNVVRVARNGRLRVEPKHAGGSIPGVRSTPKMAAEELPRGGLAAINGGFWLPAAGGRPHGVAVSDHVLFTGPKTQWGRPGHRGTLGIGADGSGIFSRLGGDLTLVPPDGRTRRIDDLNNVPLAVGAGDGELLAYTPQWDAAVVAPSGSTVVVLSDVALPVLGTASATVTMVRNASGRIAIPAGGAVLVGYGRARARLGGLAAGDTVQIRVGVGPLSIPADAWVESVDALPGGPLIVRNGRMTPPSGWVAEGFSHTRHNGPRHPRTAVGMTGSGQMLLVTVDGRRSRSVGMTMWELTELLIALGARDGLSLDGGGSTTMTVLGKTRNRISDPKPRPVANALVVRYRPDLPIRDATRNACPVDQLPEPGFLDISGHPHETMIACAAWYGIATGRTPTTFDPAGAVTRAQMASYLARMIDYAATHPGSGSGGRPLGSGAGHRFHDVPPESPHSPAIRRLATAGIITGGPGTFPATAFGPSQKVTRAQMASLLDRAVTYIRGRKLADGGNVFADDSRSTHEDAINRLANAGIVQGRSPGLYGPHTAVRRGAMTAFAQRTMELFVAAGTTASP